MPRLVRIAMAKLPVLLLGESGAGKELVGRALERLGVEHIPAYSPEARGRSERMFGTLQDRLIKELAKQFEAANRQPRDVELEPAQSVPC